MRSISTTSDVIIIGGGIHGASLAYHLKEKGVRPIILEKQFIASGATGRSSGLVRMHFDLEAESRLAWISFQYFRNWSEVVGGDCGFIRTGFLQFVEPDSEIALQANIQMHQEIGIPTFLINGDDVKRIAPYFYVEDLNIAAYEPESGYADPSKCASSFLDSARQNGAKLIQDCEVIAISSNGDQIQGVKTDQGDFTTPIVVNCAGAWAGKIGQMVGLDLPIDTWRHDTMFIRRPKELNLEHPTVIDFPNSMYFRPETGGLTLVGLEDDNPIGESPEGDSDHSKPGFVDRGIDRICKRIPGMDKGSLQSSHGEYDGITPDQRALLGAAGPEGFFLTCGFSGTGFKIAPAVGACMAELIVDGVATTSDISVFNLTRFREGEQLQGKHSYESIWR
jgi:sarcosine oxidase subunit beta